MRKTRKDFEEMAKKNSELEEAYDVLDKLSADEKKRLEYETRQRAIRESFHWCTKEHQCLIEKYEKVWLSLSIYLFGQGQIKKDIEAHGK